MADQGASYPPSAYPDKGGEQQPQQGYGFQPQQYEQYPPQQGQYPPQLGQYPPQQGQYPPQQGQYPPQQGQYPPQHGQYPQGGVVQEGAYVQMDTAVGQPTMMMVGSKANECMCLSIFTLFCCCLPLGIAAIVSSCEAEDANNAGDLNRAQTALNRAKILNYGALGLGIFFWVIGVILLIPYM